MQLRRSRVCRRTLNVAKKKSGILVDLNEAKKKPSILADMNGLAKKSSLEFSDKLPPSPAEITKNVWSEEKAGSRYN